MSHIPPLDPNVAAQKGFRESEERIKRFWKAAGVEARESGWIVLLDGRAPKTPAGNAIVLPTETAAGLVAEEWNDQGEHLLPATMPATRLASTAIDRVSQTRAPVAEEIARYAGSDVLCYLAETPSGLIERQQAEWGPWRDWAARELGVELQPVEGIIHRPQAPQALARVEALALEMDDFALTGLATAVPLFGSAVLGLAVQRGALSGETALDLSRLDEAFTEERWGVDEEAAARTAAHRAEAALLQRWFEALR
ncbi:ATP12 family protein [Brevundimonas sp. LF-1]|uniref:ATP12 family chaperone protein n=1 Tax=Brevundimonas sp. LF-1 TaxID=3126100 RepID=UPI0030E219EE